MSPSREGRERLKCDAWRAWVRFRGLLDAIAEKAGPGWQSAEAEQVADLRHALDSIELVFGQPTAEFIRAERDQDLSDDEREQKRG